MRRHESAFEHAESIAFFPRLTACNQRQRYIETGTFYFAGDGRWDISKRLSEWDSQALCRDGNSAAQALDSFDDRFGELVEPPPKP
jgi:hypothetical protein